MITIREYLKPETIEEAYKQLIRNKKNTIFGGGAFIRMGGLKTYHWQSIYLKQD